MTDSQRRLSKILEHFSCDLSPSNTASSPTLSSVHPNIASRLKSVFGDRYTEDDRILLKHGKEVIGSARTIPPSAVIYPLSTEEVSKVAKHCNRHTPKINIIPYAAGSSLESHILSSNQEGRVSISINFSKMNKVNWVKLNKHLATNKLFLGVDPAPAACIGGMVGTCCSGPSAIRYGTMRNQVINLKVVLSDGTILKTGQRAIKSVAGYDLNALFCGSEGTLGIVTEATLRLRASPECTEIAQASFEDLNAIGKCVEEINASGINLAAFEYLDPEMLVCCKKYDKKVDIVMDSHVILFKFTGPTRDHVSADIDLVTKIVKKYTTQPVHWSKDDKSRHKLWLVRKNAYWAAKFAHPGKDVLITDVAVPFSKFNDSLVVCKKEMTKSWLDHAVVGHIGDGNWHANIFYDAHDEKDVAEAHRLNDFIVSTALDLEGTCTAEHGIGKHKTKWLPRELGQSNVHFQRSLKRHIDPNCILNPGNIVEI